MAMRVDEGQIREKRGRVGENRAEEIEWVVEGALEGAGGGEGAHHLQQVKPYVEFEVCSRVASEKMIRKKQGCEVRS